jgi:hypothetical protein
MSAVSAFFHVMAQRGQDLGGLGGMLAVQRTPTCKPNGFKKTPTPGSGARENGLLYRLIHARP